MFTTGPVDDDGRPYTLQERLTALEELTRYSIYGDGLSSTAVAVLQNLIVQEAKVLKARHSDPIGQRLDAVIVGEPLAEWEVALLEEEGKRQ